MYKYNKQVLILGKSGKIDEFLSYDSVIRLLVKLLKKLIS